jgi:putative flippase GtrA
VVSAWKVPAINLRTLRGVRTVSAHSASRFLLVGGISYAFDLTTLVVLHGVFKIALSVATTLAFAAALAINFGLNRAFAFRSRSLVGPALVKYLVLVGVNYLTTLLIVLGLTALGLSYVVAKTLATAVNAVMNYVAYRGWIFKR